MFIRLSVLLLVSFTLLNAEMTKTIAFYTKNIAKVSDKDVQIAIHKILEVGSRRSGIMLQEAFPESVDAIVNGFVDGRYALITLNTYDVLQNYRQIQPYIGQMWTIAKKKKSPKMRYLLLVKRSRSKNFLDPKAKVAMLNYDYMQHLYLDSYLLKQYHKSTQNFFHKVEYFSSTSQVILKLFFSKVEACVVSEHAYNIAVELNPQLEKSLKVLDMSDKIFPSIGLTIARKGDQKIVELYDDFTYQKKDIKSLSNVLMLYKAEAIVPFTRDDMDKVREFYLSYLALKRKYE